MTDRLGQAVERVGDREFMVYWYRGQVTGVWTGIRLVLEDGGERRIRRRGVLRGARPAIAEPRSGVPSGT